MTDPTPAGLVDAVPALASYLRPATLLHPEAKAPTAHGSSLGGPALWPDGAPWPHCTAGHPDDAYEDAAPRDRETTTAVALVPVLRVRAADAPHLPWPDGADVLQVLWCPNDHDDIQGERYYYGPAVELHWQRADGLAPRTPPRPRRSDDEYLPTPCVLRPEQIRDLPDRDELPGELRSAAEEFAERNGTEYHRDLACAGGWKLGGWPSWRSTDLIPVDCGACGARMRHLLTVESGDDPDVSVGRHGELHVFVCPQDLGHPVGLDLQ
ncbi:hypothetical protein ACFVSN_21740 [Kitasatospora sp. NPDC057904]|uniref:hypothetical protein n=1 Tax=Kitasatospora sp. NPDC057904 TaxID=3346275 RepID=UPI0036DE8E05